ncbi:Sec20-domain-containing protein, partial [Pluteus cervinus]
MPPIPQVLDQEATNIVASAKRHLVDIKEFQLPRLRQCTGPLSLQQQLAAELRESTDAFASQVETLDSMILDQRGESRKAELRKVVEELRSEHTSLKSESRAALLASKRAIDAQSKSMREELLRSSTNPNSEKKGMNEKANDDPLMRANEDVTEALRRTLALMQGELERSVLTNQMLDSSTATMQSTSSTHDILTNIMGTSKQLVTALEKADWIDRLLILAGFAFFILTVLFILKQRIFDKGVYLAFWWTRFIPNPFSRRISLVDDEPDLAEVVETVTSVAASLIETLVETVTTQPEVVGTA